MKKSYASLLIKTAVALAVAAPLMASAESQLVTGTATATGASARLDFRVVIPKVLLLQVGSASGVDLVEFDLGTTTPGAGGTIARTNGTTVPVRVMGNAGDISLKATTTGALSNGAGDSISFAKISATTSNSGLPHPTLADGTTGAATMLTATNKVTNLSADWTFSYTNDVLVPAGTYGGVNTNNGRVTYTATMP